MKDKTCKKKGFNSDIFWIDGDYNSKGGLFYRAFDLNQFLRKLEFENDMNIVGLRFDENNLEVIVEEADEH